jgi:putative nucleotidyltransferase with HDIG domain
MSISIRDAIALIEGSSKYNHSFLVSSIMKQLANQFKTSEELWYLVGLLHDLDYDIIEDSTQHGVKAAEILESKLPLDAIQAIKSHDYRAGIKSESLLDSALIFADSLASFIEYERNTRIIFEEKPWLLDNLIEFSEKHDLNILTLVEKLVI